MTVYSILLFLVAALLAWVGAMIYKGNTQLIHAYHQSKVSDADRPASVSYTHLTQPTILLV